MRILLINQYAGSPTLGMEYRPHWMALEWQRAGHEVLVVAADRSHVRRQQPESIGMVDVEGVQFLFVRTLPYTENGPKRFANILSFRAQLRWWADALAGWAPDVVIASSTHPMDVRPAVRIAKKAGAAYVHEVHDLWPLTPRLLGGMPESHPMIRWMQREEDFSYAEADLVVSLLPKTEPYMREHGLAPGRWLWIPNGVDPSASVPTEQLPARVTEPFEELRRHYERVLVYAGTIGPSNGLDSLLGEAEMAARLGVAFVMVGDGQSRAHLQQEFPADNVRWIDPVRRDEVPAVLSLADGGYIGFMPSPLFEHGISPNKVYDYMGAGLPIIENAGGANSPTGEQRAGWVADPRVPTQLPEAIAGFASASADELAQMGARGRAYVETELPQSVLASRLLDAMRALT